MIVCKKEYYSHFFSVETLCFTKKSYKKGCDNHVNYKRNNARNPCTVSVAVQGNRWKPLHGGYRKAQHI